MEYKVGQIVRVKPKEWFEKYGFNFSDKEVMNYCGRKAMITEINDDTYSIFINIGPQYYCWMECCSESIEEYGIDNDGFMSEEQIKEISDRISLNVSKAIEDEFKRVFNLKIK